jgi:hypothetical protein
MNDKRIEAYLNKSTRGLWGRKKADVKEELAAHIQGRINAHLIAGYNEKDALEKTLTELGNPTYISAGMARLHSLPVVVGSGVVLTTLFALVVVFVSNTVAQVLERLEIFPSAFCLSRDDPKISMDCSVDGFWLSLENLKATLEPQGVLVKQDDREISLTFPDNAIPIILKTKSSIQLLKDDEELKANEFQPSAGYITAWEFVQGFLNSPDRRELIVKVGSQHFA